MFCERLISRDCEQSYIAEKHCHAIEKTQIYYCVSCKYTKRRECASDDVMVTALLERYKFHHLHHFNCRNSHTITKQSKSRNK